MAARFYPLPVEVDQMLVELGQRIALRRRLADMTQAELAEQVGLGISTITAIERGEPGTSIGAIARVLWGLDILSDLSLIASVRSDDSILLDRLDDVPKRIRKRRAK